MDLGARRRRGRPRLEGITHLMSNETMTASLTKPVKDLVADARAGKQDAWRELVRRYQPAVDAVTRRYRLTAADAQDVSQDVWLRLATHLTAVRTPEALPGWITTTTARCALATLKGRRRNVAVDPTVLARADESDDRSPDGIHAEAVAIEARLLRSEEEAAVREGLKRLRPQRRALLLLLVAEPRLSYQEIHEQLGLAVGSIGPTRARCLEELRQTPSVRALMESPTEESVKATMVA